MVQVYSSWFWMALLLWMRTFQRPFQKPFCGTSKGRNPPHHQCFEGLFLADGIGNDWKKWWNWRCFIEGCLNGYFGEWPLEFWQKHPSAPFPPALAHPNIQPLFVSTCDLKDIVGKGPWNQQNSVKTLLSNTILSVIEDCVMWYTSILVMVRNTEPKPLILGDGWWQCGSNLYMRIWCVYIYKLY